MIVHLENIRSFAGEHEVELAPLTFLIGENSSGKSTFLAMAASILSSPGFPVHPEFDQEPYELGPYETIATYKGGKYGRAKHFSLGLIKTLPDSSNNTKIIATYCSNQGQVRLDHFAISAPKGSITAVVKDGAVSGTIRLKRHASSNGPIEFKGPFRGGEQFSSSFLMNSLIEAVITGARRSKKDVGPSEIFEIVRSPLRSGIEPLSISPIRTKPRRTYDSASETFSPHGDHIPYILSNLFAAAARDPARQRDVDAIVAFGRQSGLYNDLTIRRFGRSPSDPFQLMIAVNGRAANISDVGYGVSQSLPVVVQTIVASKRRLMLVQQPEVHLHPRAQAALGTFFVQQVKSGKQFLIETHSDFMIDRVRQEVIKGNIPPDKVRILFFHKPSLDTQVYTLKLDRNGNVLGAPSCYREFFVKEELTLFGGDTN